MVKSPRRLPRGRPARRSAAASSATTGRGCSTRWASTRSSPPSVAGWDWGPAWLSTNTDARALQGGHLPHGRGRARAVRRRARAVDGPAAEAVARARAAAGDPWTSPETDAALMRMAERLLRRLQAQADVGLAAALRPARARPPPPAPLRTRRPAPLMPRPNAHRACNDFHATSEATRRAYLGERRPHAPPAHRPRDRRRPHRLRRAGDADRAHLRGRRGRPRPGAERADARERLPPGRLRPARHVRPARPATAATPTCAAHRSAAAARPLGSHRPRRPPVAHDAA